MEIASWEVAKNMAIDRTGWRKHNRHKKMTEKEKNT